MKAYKVLITGIDGTLGYDFYKRLSYENKINEVYFNNPKYKLYFPSRNELDITDKNQVLSICEIVNPDFIAHFAEYSNIDKAEVNQDYVRNININGTKNICEAAQKYDSTLVFLSSSYVFDGLKSGEYSEFDDANPKNFYGITKLSAEQEVQKLDKHIIIRLCWPYGFNGENYVKDLISFAESGKKEIDIIGNQIGSPTYTKDAAYAISKIMDMCQRKNNYYGIYNVSNNSSVSLEGFIKEVFITNGYDVKVNSICSDIEKNNKEVAYRPLNMRLSNDKIYQLGIDMPEWDNALNRFNNEYKKVLKRK